MSEHDIVHDAVERLESDDGEAAGLRREWQITRRGALTGGAAGLAAALLEACGSVSGGATSSAAASTRGGAASSIFGVRGGYRFAVVNHVTTNTFFAPTIAGIEDACTLLGCSYEWTGSATSDPSQMATAIDTAVGGGVDGIATSIIAPSLAASVGAAVGAGVPVITYNAQLPGVRHLAYVGQDLPLSGREMGARIRSLLPGGAAIMVFLATPGSANLQPRLNALQRELRGSDIRMQSQASGAGEAQEIKTIDAFIGAHRDAYGGYFALDGGSTAAVGLAIKRHGLTRRVIGGGFDLMPDTQSLLYSGSLQFAIDQQPYLQGFLPILQLFLHRATRGLTGAADVDTGVRLLDRATIRPFHETSSRYEGTSTAAGVQTA